MAGAPPPGYILVPVPGNSTGDIIPTNQVVPFQPPPAPEPPKEPPREPPMVPGRTYITIPPGHTRPAFVRKKGPKVGMGLGLLAEAFGNPRRDVTQVANKPKEGPKPKPDPPQVQQFYYYLMPHQQQQQQQQQPQQLQLAGSGTQSGPNQATQQLELRPPPPAQIIPEPSTGAPKEQSAPAATANEDKSKDKEQDRQATPAMARYQCFYCHKVRSASYHRRHPILTGQDLPLTVCRKCQRDRTPSGDEKDKKFKEESRKRKKERKEKKNAKRKEKHTMSMCDEESLERSQNDGSMHRARRRRPSSGIMHVPRIARNRNIEQDQHDSCRRRSMISEEESETYRYRRRVRNRSPLDRSKGMSSSRYDRGRWSPERETWITRRNYPAQASSRSKSRATSYHRPRSRSVSNNQNSRSDERRSASSRDETHIIRRRVVTSPPVERQQTSRRKRTGSNPLSASDNSYGVRSYTIIRSRPIVQAHNTRISTQDCAHQSQRYGQRSTATANHNHTPCSRAQEERDQRFNRPQGTYSGHIRVNQKSPRDRMMYETPTASLDRSISRPLRVSSALEYQQRAAQQHNWDSDTADIGGPRVQFVRDTSTRRNNISDRESDIEGHSRRRQRPRAADFDGYRHEIEDEYAPPQRFSHSITYHAPSPPPAQSEPCDPHPHYLTAAPYYSETEISDLFREARITYSPSLASTGRSRSRGRLTGGGRSFSHSRRSSVNHSPYTRQPRADGSKQGSVRYVEARPLHRRSSEWSVASASTGKTRTGWVPGESFGSLDSEGENGSQRVTWGRDDQGPYYDVVETVTLGEQGR